MATPISKMQAASEEVRLIRIPSVGYVKSFDVQALLFGLRFAGVQVPMTLKSASRMSPAQRATILKEIAALNLV